MAMRGLERDPSCGVRYGARRRPGPLDRCGVCRRRNRVSRGTREPRVCAVNECAGVQEEHASGVDGTDTARFHVERRIHGRGRTATREGRSSCSSRAGARARRWWSATSVTGSGPWRDGLSDPIAHGLGRAVRRRGSSVSTTVRVRRGATRDVGCVCSLSTATAVRRATAPPRRRPDPPAALPTRRRAAPGTERPAPGRLASRSAAGRTARCVLRGRRSAATESSPTPDPPDSGGARWPDGPDARAGSVGPPPAIARCAEHTSIRRPERARFTWNHARGRARPAFRRGLAGTGLTHPAGETRMGATAEESA